MPRIVPVVFLSILSSLPLIGGDASAVSAGPVEAVRSLYVPTIWNPLAVTGFAGVTEPALPLLERNAKLTQASGEGGCIDFVPTVDSQDFDDAEIGRTLAVVDLGEVALATHRVSAKFKLFQEDREIIWTMRKVGEVWKIADIESLASEWRLSTLPCED